MCLKNDYFFKAFYSWILSGRKKTAEDSAPKFYSGLLFFGIILLFSISLTNMTWASEQGTENYENIDARWLPWMGSWQLLSKKVNASESSSSKDYFLTISPGSNGKSIVMKGHQGDKVMVEEEIIADGHRHQLNDKKCSGYYVYTWSETGKRLLLESESNCPGDPPRKISGMSIIDENSNWLDIQLLQNGEDKAISIRKYRNIDSDSITSSRFNPGKISVSRIAAGKNFSIDEIIELSSKVEPEVLETALLETRKPFPINSKQLVRLADAGVNSRTVDLMVAFSFPDKFTVEQEKISLAQSTRTTEGKQVYYSYFRHPYNYYSYYCPILPWHWASSSYMAYAYDYSYLGWYLADRMYYYPLWTYPPQNYYYGGGGGTVRDRDGGATVVKGKGFVRGTSDSSASSTRRALPRNAPAVQRAPVQATSSGGSSSGYSGGGSSGSSGGSSSGSVSTSSGSSQPVVTPNGFSRGR